MKYTSYSVLRIAASYLISIIAALGLGFWMATNRRVELILLPVLDILQSVPVVGFFPVAIAIFIAIFNGERIGVELASIFLIFTSQAWNIIFGVYESIKVLPKDMKRMILAFNIKGFIAFRRIYLPHTIPSLVYNSMISWSNSWFFLMASEVFAIGAKQFELPGVGSFIWKASERGDIVAIISGLLAIAITGFAMSIFIWEPLSSWSKKFSLQMLPYTEEKPENFVLSQFKDFFYSIIRKPLRYEEAFKKGAMLQEKILAAADRVLSSEAFLRFLHFLRLIVKIAITALALAISFKLISVAINLFRNPFPEEAKNIPLYLSYSFARLFLAYLLCLFFTFAISFAYYFSKESVAELMLTFFRILASIPGTVLQPILLAWLAIRGIYNPLHFTSILVLFSTMLWYMIFPVAARIKTIPREIKEPFKLFSRSNLFTLKKLVIPASFPGLVTGSFAAWGAGWNALVVAEFSYFNKTRYHVEGIGYLIDYSAYINANSVLMTLSLATLVIVIIVLNKIIWQRLYDYAEERFPLDID